jgi:hypothetical protein
MGRITLKIISKTITVFRNNVSTIHVEVVTSLVQLYDLQQVFCGLGLDYDLQ